MPGCDMECQTCHQKYPDLWLHRLLVHEMDCEVTTRQHEKMTSIRDFEGKFCCEECFYETEFPGHMMVRCTALVIASCLTTGHDLDSRVRVLREHRLGLRQFKG